MPDPDGVAAIARLFRRSEEFESALASCLSEVEIALAGSGVKAELCATASMLSIEHASVLRSAFASTAPNTGAALLRLQYEAILRAAWIAYASNPGQLEKLARNLGTEAEQAAKNLPSNQEMLKAVCKHAPEGLSAPLAEFNQYSRHALNSFVHTGIHPLRRAQEGFPVEMAHQVVLLSNGLLHIAYRMLAVLSGSKRIVENVTRLYLGFKDCLPVVESQPGGNRSGGVPGGVVPAPPHSG